MEESQEPLLSPNESIDLNKLQALREIFDHADEDGGGGLDMDEFLAAFGKIFAKRLNQQELTNLFMKIDANSDGTVDWNEFTEYMLLENEGKELVEENSANGFQFNQDDEQVQHLPQHRRRVIRLRNFERSGLFATCSKDSSLTLWGADCDGKPRFVKRIKCPSAAELHQEEATPSDHTRRNARRKGDRRSEGLLRQKGSADDMPWVNDCVIMEHSKQLAIAASTRTIAFYDLTLAYAQTGRLFVDHSPLCLEYFHGESVGSDIEVLVCADAFGYIQVWHLQASHWAFHSSNRYKQVSQGVVKHMKCKVHDDVVTCMAYYDDLGKL